MFLGLFNQKSFYWFLKAFITDKAQLMTPRAIYICDGSAFEYEEMVESLERLQYFRNPSPRVAAGQPDLIDVEDAHTVCANTYFTTKYRPRSRYMCNNLDPLLNLFYRTSCKFCRGESWVIRVSDLFFKNCHFNL